MEYREEEANTWGLNADVLGSLQCSKESGVFLFILYVGVYSTAHRESLFSFSMIPHQPHAVGRIGLKLIIMLEGKILREVK